MRIFFSALLLTLFSRRFGGSVWIHALGWWLILSTLNLHFLGCSFARTMLLDHGISNWLRRLLVLALAAAGRLLAGSGPGKPCRHRFPPGRLPISIQLRNYVQQVLISGPALYLLYPFRLLVRPFFAPDAAAFFTALAPALLLFSLHYLWVICSDVAFEEASVEASQKLATRIAAIRAGNWQAARKNQKARRAWFSWRPPARPATALLWKNLIGVGQIFSARLWIFLASCVAVFLGLGGNTRPQNISTLAALVIATLLGYSLLLGPQFLRLDFRQDLPLADMLKTFPLRGWQIALGEILAPAVVLAGIPMAAAAVRLRPDFFLPGKHGGRCWRSGSARRS